MRRRSMFDRWLPRVLAALWLVGMAALSVGGYGLLARPHAADVAIVFGNTVNADGTPSARLVARLQRAREVYAAGNVRTLFVSGALGREGHEESRVMRDWLVAHGVPATAVVRDSLGVNSAATAANARDWMRARGWKRVVVVTQWFHVARATLACTRAGLEVTGGAAPRWYEPRDGYSLAREMVALPAYAVRPGGR